MEVTEAQNEAISRLRPQVQCSKSHICVEAGIDPPCEVYRVGYGEDVLLQCLGKEPCAGQCSEIFLYSMRVCNCPLRQYIWKEFGR